MNRWQYPFNKKKDAEKHLQEAEKETGKKCSVFQVSTKAYIFKIFTSKKEFQEYQKQKKLKQAHGH